MDYYSSKVTIFNKLFCIALESWQSIHQPFLGKHNGDWGRESSPKVMQYCLKERLQVFFCNGKRHFHELVFIKSKVPDK